MSGLSVSLRWCFAILVGSAAAAQADEKAADQASGDHELAQKLTESTHDWQGQRLTLPVNLTAGHLFRLASPPINLSGGLRYTVTARAGEAQWAGG